MWVFTPFGFFSAVAHRDKPGFLMVRARAEADLRELLARLPGPKPRLERTPSADYGFRLTLKASRWADLLSQFAESELDYDNFKNRVAEVQGNGRAALYHDVWEALLPLQRAHAPTRSEAR